MPRWFGLRPVPISRKNRIGPIIVTYLKRGQKWKKNNNLEIFTKIQSNSLIRSLGFPFLRFQFFHFSILRVKTRMGCWGEGEFFPLSSVSCIKDIELDSSLSISSNLSSFFQGNTFWQIPLLRLLFKLYVFCKIT